MSFREDSPKYWNYLTRGKEDLNREISRLNDKYFPSDSRCRFYSLCYPDGSMWVHVGDAYCPSKQDRLIAGGTDTWNKKLSAKSICNELYALDSYGALGEIASDSCCKFVPRDSKKWADECHKGLH